MEYCGVGHLRCIKIDKPSMEHDSTNNTKAVRYRAFGLRYRMKMPPAILPTAITGIEAVPEERVAFQLEVTKKNARTTYQ